MATTVTPRMEGTKKEGPEKTGPLQLLVQQDGCQKCQAIIEDDRRKSEHQGPDKRLYVISSPHTQEEKIKVIRQPNPLPG